VVDITRKSKKVLDGYEVLYVTYDGDFKIYRILESVKEACMASSVAGTTRMASVISLYD